MPCYADYRYEVGFRCHPCEIISGPFWDSLSEIHYYKIKFTDVIEGTIAPEQMECDVPVHHIFDTPIELVDLPEECYWGFTEKDV